MNQITPLWTRSFCLLTLSHFLGALGYASMVLLPLYLAHLGGTRSEIGAIMAGAHLAGLVTRPLVGWSLDSLGRKSSLILGAVLTSLSLGSVYWITDLGPFTYGVRILFGMSEGFIFTGYFAFATDLIPENRRTEGLALFGVSGLLPLLVNPIADLGGYQGEELRFFIASVSLLILGAALLIFWIPSQHSDTSQHSSDTSQHSSDTSQHSSSDTSQHSSDTFQHSSDTSQHSSTLQYLLSSHLIPLWWSSIAFAGGVSLMMTFASVVGEARGMNLPTATWFTYVAGAVLARLFGAKLPERVGPAKLIRPTLVLYGVALMMCAFSEDSWGMLGAGLLAGIAHGYAFPVLTSLIVSAVHDRYRGRALAMFTGLWGGAAVLFALIGGTLADMWGDTLMLATLSCCILGTAIYAKAERFSTKTLV